MPLVDTHCHIHDPSYKYNDSDLIKGAKKKNVLQMITIGTSADDSQQAVDYANSHNGVWASVGVHPHNSKVGEDDFELLTRLIVHPKTVAIGEFGLDYYYENSSKSDQIPVFEAQLELAKSFSKPCVFHVREAFEDFWPILDNFTGIKGVIHSFSASTKEVEEGINRGLFFGLNGIMTFTKDQSQLDAAKKIPLSNLVLETDSPYLTPPPLRGTMNVPANVRLVAAYLAELRGETLEQLIEATTQNARQLFALSSETIN